MAIIHPVIVPAKALKGGRHKIRISVAHNGETRYIQTDITIDSASEFRHGAIVNRADASILNTKLRGILQHYQSTIDELEYVSGMSCAELVFQMKDLGRTKHRSIGSIYEEYMANGKFKDVTRSHYVNLWRRISSFLSPMTLAENINHSTILALDKFIKSEGLSSTTHRDHMVFVIVLLNYARRCGYIQYTRDPFIGYELPAQNVRESWLSVDEIRAIRDADLSDPKACKCRDIFMLSYYLGGINMIDLKDINFAKSQNTIKYVRIKTENRHKMNKYVEFDIPTEAKEIIGKYIGEDGRLSMTESQRRTNLNDFFKYYLPKVAAAAGIESLIYYSARKSFSQHAFRLGVNTPVIDFILGHRVDKGGTALYSYISVTPEMASDAVRLVLDNLK